MIAKERNNSTQTLAAFYSPRHTSERTTLARTTLWRMVRRGEFPAPIRISPGRVGFPVDLVEAWIQERLEGAS